MIFALRFMIEEEPIINCKARDILVSWVEKFRFFSFMKILEKEFSKRGVENSSTIRTFLHASTTFNTNFGITHDLFFQFNGFNGTNFDAVLTLCTQFVNIHGTYEAKNHINRTKAQSEGWQSLCKTE